MNQGERDQLIEKYADGPAQLRAALEKAPETMRKWQPGPGEFSVHEVICHCADSETNSHARIRYLIAEENPHDHRIRPGQLGENVRLHEPPDRRVATNSRGRAGEHRPDTPALARGLLGEGGDTL